MARHRSNSGSFLPSPSLSLSLSLSRVRSRLFDVRVFRLSAAEPRQSRGGKRRSSWKRLARPVHFFILHREFRRRAYTRTGPRDNTRDLSFVPPAARMGSRRQGRQGDDPRLGANRRLPGRATYAPRRHRATREKYPTSSAASPRHYSRKSITLRLPQLCPGPFCAIFSWPVPSRPRCRCPFHPFARQSL
jgi:hypothetical protein